MAASKRLNPLRTDDKQDPSTPEGCIESLFPFVGGAFALLVAFLLSR